MLSRLAVRVRAFCRSEDGPTAVEYAVVAALIVGLVVGALALLGSSSSNVYDAADSGATVSTP